MSDSTLHQESSRLLTCFYYVEIPLFVCATVFAYILHSTSVFKTNPVSYLPDDVTIAKPYLRNAHVATSSDSIFMIANFTPFILIIIIEVVLMSTKLCCNGSCGSALFGSSGCIISDSLRRLVRFIGIYFYGALATSAVCDILQKNIPSLSPHFLSVCDAELKNTFYSTKGSGFQSRDTRYFSDDCTPLVGVKELIAARLQCPSYLVSIASFCAAYLTMYLRLVVHRWPPVIRSVTICTPLLYPYCFGLIEVANFTSHASSVVYGWVLGSAIAYLLGHKIFKRGFMHYCNCPNVCSRRQKSKGNESVANNVFEVEHTPTFSNRGYRLAEGDDISEFGGVETTCNRVEPKNHNVNSSMEPASTKGSTVALRDDTVSISATTYNGHTVERRVIKELKTYIADADHKSSMESPKPTQIRVLSRGTNQNNRQHFSTFQATPESEAPKASVSDLDASNSNIGSNRDGAWVCETSRPDQTGKAKFSPTINFVSSFQNAPPLDGRPFSYHGGDPSFSSNESLAGDFGLMPPGAEIRPTSFSHPLRPSKTSTPQSQTDDSEPRETILSYFGSQLDSALSDIKDQQSLNSASTLTSLKLSSEADRSMATSNGACLPQTPQLSRINGSDSHAYKHESTSQSAVPEHSERNPTHND